MTIRVTGVVWCGVVWWGGVGRKGLRGSRRDRERNEERVGGVQ